MYACIGATRAAYFDLRTANGPRGSGKLARNCAGVFLLLPPSIPRAFILYCHFPNRHPSKLDEKQVRRQRELAGKNWLNIVSLHAGKLV